MIEGKVAESIFDNGSVVIPMRDVQHIERRGIGNLMVVMKSSTHNAECGEYNNAVFIPKVQADGFLKEWCEFRSQLDAPILQDLSK